MKKFLTLLALLTSFVSGAMAGVVTDRASAGDPLTFSQFQALAGTGKHFALMAPSAAELTYKKWFSFSKAGYPTTLTTVQLFDLENSATGDGWYNIKRISDGLYVSTEGGNFASTPKMDFKLVNRRAGDYASEFSNSDLHVSLDNAAGNHYNCNTTNLGFRAGTGGYSTYITYGPFYLVTVNCLDGGGNPLQDPVTYIVTDGTTINAPEVPPYISNGESVTVDGADAVLNCYYTAPASTVNVTYELYENGVLLDSKVVLQAANSEVSIPTSMVTETDYYDYATSGTIGESDCTITVTRTVKAENLFPAIPSGLKLSIASATNTMTPATSADDNDHWYIITQVRGGETPMYDAGLGIKLMRAATSVTTATLNGTDPTADTQYLVRFFSTATEGLYNIQFANGHFITSSLTTAKKFSDAGTYAFYNTVAESPTFAWNLNTKEGSRVDNNAAGYTLSFWGTGTVTSTSGNNIWTVYPVSFVDEKGELAAAILSTTQTFNNLSEKASTVVVGYPNASALAALEQAISDAQYVYDNGGDYVQATEDLADALAAAQSVANAVYTPRTDVYYTLTNANVPSGNRGSMVYDSSHSSSTDASGNEFLWYTNSLDATNINHLWGFVLYEGKYYMYNVGKRQFANVTQSGSYQGSNGDKHTWMFSDTPSAVVLDAGEGNWVATPNVRVRATSEVTGKQYAMSISTSYTGPVIAYDAVDDGGIPMFFAVSSVSVDDEVTAAIEALLNDPTPYIEALQAVIDDAEAYPVGPGLNQYSAPAGFADALAAAKSEVADEDATKASLNAARTALEEATEGLTLNMPEDNTFLRIKLSQLMVAAQPYLLGELSEVEGYTDRLAYDTDADDATSIWYFDGTSLYNYGKGGYALVNNSGQAAVSATAGAAAAPVAFTVAAKGERGAYNVQFDGTRYLYGEEAGYANAGDNGNGNGYSFNLELVDELPLTVSAAGYATLYSPVALAVPAGITAYKAADQGTSLKLSPIAEHADDVIPALTGVILAGTAGDYTFTVTTTEETVAENALTGTPTAIARPENSYILATGTEGVAFYGDGSEVIPGFKAYLQAEGGEPVKTFSFDVETGIGSMKDGEWTMDNCTIYNLAGQRVTKTQKGIYVVNGKKVVIE